MSLHNMHKPVQTVSRLAVAPRYFVRIFGLCKRLQGGSENPGTGSGLTICKRIVELHGRRIWVETASWQGATFFFTLPARALPNQATATRNTPP